MIELQAAQPAAHRRQRARAKLARPLGTGCPGCTDELRPLVQLAEKAVAAQPKAYPLLNTLGIAHYRASHIELAVGRLNDAVTAHGRGGEPWDWLFLAMAHHRLGHAAESRKWAEQAFRWIDQETGEKKGTRGSRLPWEQRLELQLLRREAEKLLSAATP